MWDIFLFLAVLLSIVIGANSIIASLGTAYGSRVISMKHGIILVIIFTFIGAFWFSENVMNTVGNNIATITFPFPTIISALIVGVIVLYLRIPTSITQIVIGAIIGSSLASGVYIFWDEVAFLIIAWTIAPVIVLLLSMALYFFFVKMFLGKNPELERKLHLKKYFMIFQVIMGLLLAMVIAGNSVGVAMGIGIGIESLLALELIGAIGLSIGIATWGRKILKSVSGGFTKLTPEKAFFAQLSGFIVLLFFVLNGIPASPTTMIIAAIMGVGLISGKFNSKRFKQLVFTWVIIIPLSVIIGFVITSLMLL